MRVVWSGRTGEIEGVRLRSADTQGYRSVRPTERLVADVRQAFAHFVAEDIVATVWPALGTGMGSLVSSAELLNVAEELLDPRLLAAEVVRVMVQIAAVHAGIPPPVARVMGQAAGDLFVSVVSPDPDAGEVQAVRCVDLALSAEGGSVIDSPALPQMADDATADVIDRLLAPDDPPPSTRPSPSPEPLRKRPVTPASPRRDPATSSPPAPASPYPVPPPPYSIPASPHPDPDPDPDPDPSKPKPTEIDHPGFGFGP